MADDQRDASKRVVIGVHIGSPSGSGQGSSRGGRPFPTGLYFGLAILVFGLILLLDQMGVASADYILGYFWPAVFIFFGAGLLSRASSGARFWGVVLTIVGFLLVLSQLHFLHVTAAVIWPVAIILWGLWMMMQAVGRGPKWKWAWVNECRAKIRDSIEIDSGEFQPESVAIFSSVKRRITSKEFEGGKLTAVFGSFEIDLREAEMKGDEAEIEANAVFGGGEIFVPTNWLVSVNGAAVFGEYSDKTRRRDANATKRLIIKGAAVFGAVIIKN
jgi:predicted membrane protein